ncbi:hypothetical protein LJB87_00205 [Alistipes sp. OttesenSCG-928-L06]|nr:hypothetical protein [Alistipes sp. OttesenSCG-928-L06]
MKKSEKGHYCRICGKHKANEKFSGKGHSAHICKNCSSLPLARRNEMERMNRVGRIADKLRLTKEEWDLLEKYSASRTYPELREYASDVLEHHRFLRESRKPQIEQTAYAELDEELQAEIGELLYDDLFTFMTDRGNAPTEKQLARITKGIFEAYLRHYHLQITVDDTWHGKVKKVLETVIRDIEDDAELPDFELPEV